MRPLVANTDDLVSILDRVLDKGIVMETWAPVDVQGNEQWVADAHPASSALLFPSATVRRRIGKKAGKVSTFCSRIGGAISGANNAAQNCTAPSARGDSQPTPLVLTFSC